MKTVVAIITITLCLCMCVVSSMDLRRNCTKEIEIRFPNQTETKIFQQLLPLLNITCNSNGSILILNATLCEDELYSICHMVLITVFAPTDEQEIMIIERLIVESYKNHWNSSALPITIRGVQLVFLNGSDQTKQLGPHTIEVSRNDGPTALYLYNSPRSPTPRKSNIESEEYPYVYTSKSILGILHFDENHNVVEGTSNFSVDFSNDTTLSVVHPLARAAALKIRCGFLNPNKNSWDTTGCNTITAGLHAARCDCNHTTNFAVLFAIRLLELKSPWPEISYVFEITSLVFLVVTAIMVFFNRKRLRNFNRSLVQMNICVALFLFHLCTVLEKQALGDDNLCRVMAALILTFLIASALLMVFEGVLMLLTVSGSITSVHGEVMRRRRVSIFVGLWTVCIIYSAVTAIALSAQDVFLYKGNRAGNRIITSCTISYEWYLLTLIPVALALSVNTFIVCRLGYMVWKMSKNTEKFKPSDEAESNNFHVARALRAVLTLMTLLGIPWIFGYLVNIKEYYLENIFLAMHLLFNGLQGVFIFAHYVILSTEMRRAVANSWKSALSSKDSYLLSMLFTSKKEDSVELRGI